MQAEWAKRQAEEARLREMEPRPDRTTDDVIEAIEKAAQYIDEGHTSGTKFSPSATLKIGYCVIATSSLPLAEIRAERFVRRTLARARNLYRQGFYADPFAKEPMERLAK
jgi:hypothetical protein